MTSGGTGKRGTKLSPRLLLCVALSACAGAGGTPRGPAPLPAAEPIAPASGTGNATLSIKVAIPKVASANSRNPAYVAAGTQSVTVAVTPPGGTPAAPVLITCSSGTCSGSVGAPIGNDTVTVKHYDQPAGAGNLLSTGTSSVNVGANTANSVNLTFNPVVWSYTFAASGTLSAGTVGTAAVGAVAYDADGNTIVGPGSYVDGAGNPLTITLTGVHETGGNTTMALSGNMTFTGPSSANATLTYNGDSSYSATFSGASSPARSMVPGTPLPVNGYLVSEYSTPTAGATPWMMTAGPDGNLWFSESGVNKIGKITMSGAIVEYPVAGGARPIGITTGPDGRIWFAEDNAAKIGRINTDGTGYVEYAAAGGAMPAAIVAGPDGNLWFTDTVNNSIGVMSTSGVLLHKYTAGITAGGLGWNGVFSIIVGPDMNLWFTENDASKIARITTTGTVTEFADASGAGYLGIGPDGNLWNATNTPALTIGNTSGSIVRTYGYPTDADLSSAQLNAIVQGSDGNMWMSDWHNPVIYRMSVNNAVTVYSNGISSNPGFSWITTGPDGNIWFVETSTSKIGKLTY